MPYRNANYAAFYVDEPFSQSNLGANQAEDFRYYNLLKAWKGDNSSFPFVDAHGKTYDVRDDSSWDTLKTRLRERLRCSKNIVLFLSSRTKNSRALREEIDYGINTLELPVIVIYPEYKDKSSILNGSGNGLSSSIVSLWGALPIFRDSMNTVPTIHVPLVKNCIKNALSDSDFAVGSSKSGCFFYRA